MYKSDSNKTLTNQEWNGEGGKEREGGGKMGRKERWKGG